MKNLSKKLNNIGVFFIAIIIVSCSSTDDSAMENGGGEPSGITYDSSIKSIMSSKCTSCHGSTPTQNAPMSLTTYTDVVDAVNNKDLIGRIKSTTNPMPPTGNKLTSTQISNIESWIANGMPEN